VSDIPAKLLELERHHADALSIDHLDGVTIQYRDWWMNVRPSNTEPLLRSTSRATRGDSWKGIATKRSR